jgi:hypothetical protein
MPALTGFFATNQHQRDPTPYSRLFAEIVDGGNSLGIALTAPEDPYVILDVVRRIFIAFSSPFALLPRLSPPCGSPECPLIEGDLEYCRGFNGSYSVSPNSCARCGHGGVPRLEFLP